MMRMTKTMKTNKRRKRKMQNQAFSHAQRLAREVWRYSHRCQHLISIASLPDSCASLPSTCTKEDACGSLLISSLQTGHFGCLARQDFKHASQKRCPQEVSMQFSATRM